MRLGALIIVTVAALLLLSLASTASASYKPNPFGGRIVNPDPFGGRIIKPNPFGGRKHSAPRNAY